jgi:hypothetical protein
MWLVHNPIPLIPFPLPRGRGEIEKRDSGPLTPHTIQGKIFVKEGYALLNTRLV